MKSYQDLSDVANYIGAPLATLQQTLTEWAEFVAIPNGPNKRAQDPHASPGSIYTGNNDLSTGPWYCLWLAPGIHFTMGGIAVNRNTEVLAASGLSVTDIPGNNTNPQGQTFNRNGVKITGTPIPGLYAAGEVTGGIHGGNREGGNSVLDIQIYGRVAGYNAARYVNNLPPGNPPGFVEPRY
ncbi:MAG: FAD-binding protein, partial [Treponema sp.]|nr:FAD-binding protein [Treponema sp.]